MSTSPLTRLRFFLGAETAGFVLAALVHAGVLFRGYEHSKAATAETVIGVVLGLGLLGTLLAPPSSRPLGLGAQGFALLGTLVGLFTIAIGVGPQSTFDLALHAGFVTLLVTGLVDSARRRSITR